MPSWAPTARRRGTRRRCRVPARAGRTSRTWNCGTWAPPWELGAPRARDSIDEGRREKRRCLVGPPRLGAEEHGDGAEYQHEQDELRVHGTAGHGLLLGSSEPLERGTRLTKRYGE